MAAETSEIYMQFREWLGFSVLSKDAFWLPSPRLLHLLIVGRMRIGSRNGIRIHLESQVAQKKRPLHPKIAHTSLNLANKYQPLAFQEGSGVEFWEASERVEVRE